MMKSQLSNNSISTAILVGLFLLVALSSQVFLQSTVNAQGRYFREEWKLPDWYPRGFDGYGILNRISDDVVVVSDTSFELSADVTYNTPEHGSASAFYSGAGRTVAYLLNSDRQVESLWLIE